MIKSVYDQTIEVISGLSFGNCYSNCTKLYRLLKRSPKERQHDTKQLCRILLSQLLDRLCCLEIITKFHLCLRSLQPKLIPRLGHKKWKPLQWKSTRRKCKNITINLIVCIEGSKFNRIVSITGKVYWKMALYECGFRYSK